MKNRMQIVIIVATLLMASLQQQAQVLEVSVINIGNNTIHIIGVPTAPGFSTSSGNAWTSMNLTWRIPKTAAIPVPTVAPPAATPEVTGESTAFTGAAPRNTFDGQMDLTIFDLTSFGQPDDNYWYFQLTGTNGGVQNLATGSPTVLYSFTLPAAWRCAACVEILTSDIPGLPISTNSFIDNASMGVDVLQLAVNNAPLPVHFISFEAHKNRDQVQLNWRVSNEENLHGYYVERSGDGINYTQIGFVAPKPAAAFNDYAFTDVAPLDNMNYYRIHEEDIDGRSINSVVRVVKMQESGFVVSLYPVPVKDVLMLKLNTNNNGPAYIRITDMLGRTLLQRRIQLNAGNNIQKIPVHGFVNGMYFIEVAGAGVQWAGKFVKE
jgi:hypothetical protein